MTDVPYVLEPSAVLAAFFHEAGVDVVAERMSGALLSAVNAGHRRGRTFLQGKAAGSRGEN